MRIGIRIGGGLESGLLRDWNQDWWRFGIRIGCGLELMVVERLE
jgi:hypothetical protein